MYIGVDYYPEHWPRERWETDARLMREAGFNVVRLAEFSWILFEPAEGRYEFSWLDEAIALLRDHGISVILGTPTAIMPAWCARRYPASLAMQKDGTRIVWGVRKNNCFSNGDYRRLGRGIVAAMAEHYAGMDGVIGWQTDNEFGQPFCYCDDCRASFQRWLKEKYVTLDELNHAWGTHFWGQRYGQWEQIPIPVDCFSHNPSACLDWQRHFSHLHVSFQAEQVKILREKCSKHFVTHNFMGLFPELNYFDLARDLDFVSWDNYPTFGGGAPPAAAACAADLMRGLKGKNFWIMEQTAGPCGWGVMGRNVRPGELRSISYQQLAHGADGQIWFRWRSCTAGREQYWHGLLGHDGVAGRRYQEAAQVAREYQRLAPLLEGTIVRSDVALIFDYDSLWALNIQPGYEGSDNYRLAVRRWYDALFRAGVNVDLVSTAADFSGYKAVFAPHLHVVDDELARRLEAFVHAGGVLAAGCRTAVKDATNLISPHTLPGNLRACLGIRIDEYEALPGIEYRVTGPAEEGCTAIAFCDWITPESAEILARFDTWHLADYAAATRNRFGQGQAFYAGIIAKEPAFYDRMVREALAAANVHPPLANLPGNVEVSLRQGNGQRLLFIVNHNETPATVNLPRPVRELLSGRDMEQLELDRLGVAVLDWSEA